MEFFEPYLAGILDGEGYIGILKHHKKRVNGTPYVVFTPRVIISFLDRTQNRKVISLFKKRFGGCNYAKKIYEYSLGYERKSHNAMFTYEVRGAKTIHLLKSLERFLIIKKKQAKLVLGIGFNIGGRRSKLTKLEVKRRIHAMEAIKRLNGNKPFDKSR